MKVRLAKKIGFCFGVKRAIEMARKALEENRDVYSLGSIIHNRQVVEDLSKMGLKVITNLDGIKSGTIVISSHGISPKVAAKIRKRGFNIIDTTCPFVLNAQRIAKSLSDAGYHVIIVGEARHPEVKALVDFVTTRVSVVRGGDEAKRLKVRPDEKVSIIAQTTQALDNFLEVVRVISEKRPKELKVMNTICKDVKERQMAAAELTRNVEMMFVVGGRNSANTNRLLEICRRISKNAYLLETEKDLNGRSIGPSKIVGITSGASTPDWIVKKVVNKLTNLQLKFNRKGLCN